MSLIRCNYFSATLDRDVGAYVALPEYETGERLPVCYLLHDFYENYTKWVRSIPVERLAEKYHMTIVMPDGNKSFYLDETIGEKYFTYITEELPTIITDYFSVAKEKQDTLVAGVGMGGYGALRIALLKPKRYYAAAGFNAMTDIKQVMENFAEHPNSMNRQAESLFGGLDKIESSTADLFHLSEQASASDISLYVSYASGSSCAEMNRAFVSQVKQTSIPIYESQKGSSFLEEFLYKSLDEFLSVMKSERKEKWDIFSTYRDYGCV